MDTPPTPPVRPGRTLGLGILAHVDAGKTSLTERLLLHAGVIAELGSVDDGSTQTDTLALERDRGITIKAAVVSFELGRPGDPDPLTVNLVDTPGHSDFIAEVERSLAVLDGAVLVVSAVEGVQAQTRVLMRALRRLRIPTVLFVNKVDRSGARTEVVLREVVDRLGVTPVPLGRVVDEGTRAAAVVPDGLADLGLPARGPAEREDAEPEGGDRDAAAARERVVEALSRADDRLLADWLDAPHRVDASRLRAALGEQTRRGLVCPVLLGSAMTGAGVEDLAQALPDLLPARTPDPDAPLAATVFAVQRGASGEKVALVSVTSGSLAVRDRVLVHDGRTEWSPAPDPDPRHTTSASGDDGARCREERVTGLSVHARGEVRRVARVPAGRIARVVGLERARIGDLVGDAALARPLVHEFSPPTLETVVEACDPAERALLHTALTRLAEQDPLIDLRHDEVRGETHVSLYGEVQKEVIGATLEAEYAVAARFSTTSVICRERVTGSGAAFELIDVAPNPFLATVGLRVDPGPPGSGVRFSLEVELGSMPASFFTAVEDTVRATLGQGLHGWPVTDCVVTMTHSGYWPRQSHMHQKFDPSMSSTAGDFRALTPLVLMEAVRLAGTAVEEPVHRFDLEVPSDVLGAALSMLGHVRASPRETAVLGPVTRLRGEVPAERLHELQQRVPGLTSGLGDLVTAFDGYRPVVGPAPTRSRTDLDPLHRREYLLRLAGKLSAQPHSSERPTTLE
ncbi:translation factor GTPase family protein [Terracoccus sp. 273MFTsu3.1]|uniref:elongation factor G n=1 Tax=Terracoccus sp. 273MFTsu3.1 TaxID=1172188 RepID=UPI0003A3D102|nr:TetM/TetW/TetO/TetS family tetracycline resistance ribosomal protection protein [Terracoccus sp. 273MFTsu3.1]